MKATRKDSNASDPKEVAPAEPSTPAKNSGAVHASRTDDARKAKGPSLMDSKPGSEPAHAPLPHDFGANVNNPAESRYASHGIQNQDPGRRQERSTDERDGTREAGAGIDTQGTGAGSGGDIDTDLIGFGTAGGLAANMPDEAERNRIGADSTDGSADVFASGKPAAGENQDPKRVGISDRTKRGDMVSIPRDNDRDRGEANPVGADAIRTTDAEDPYLDAAAGEISRGESEGPADSSSSTARD